MTGRSSHHVKFKGGESPDKPANRGQQGSDDLRISAKSSLYAGAAPPKRLSKNQVYELLDRLGERDIDALTLLSKCRYLTTAQIMRLFIPLTSTPTAQKRTATRMMYKLRSYGLVRSFDRRIGGVRAGSSSYVWHLSEAGFRFLSLKNHTDEDKRPHRLLEPTQLYLDHTLAVSELYVRLVELQRSDEDIKLESVQWEPECWRKYSKNSHNLKLKPDLFFSIRNGDYEDRWFVEVDCDSESIPVVLRKCERYHEYFRTGLEQQKYHVFPATVWVVPTEERKQNIIKALDDSKQRFGKMFTVITPDEFEHLIQTGF